MTVKLNGDCRRCESKQSEVPVGIFSKVTRFWLCHDCGVEMDIDKIQELLNP